MYTKIEFGTRRENIRDMAFVIPFARKAQPYLKYNHIQEEKRIVNIPLVMCQMRWDGYIGFIGGNVDKGEDLLKAALREATEEIGVCLVKSRLKPLVSYDGGDAIIHSYTYECSFRELQIMQKMSMSSPHFLAENQGCILLQIAKFNGDKGYEQVLKNNWIATSKLELIELVESENLLVTPEIEKNVLFTYEDTLAASEKFSKMTAEEIQNIKLDIKFSEKEINEAWEKAIKNNKGEN